MILSSTLVGLGCETNGCQRRPDTAATEERTTIEPRPVLRLPLEEPPITLDPVEAGDAVSRRAVGQLFDTLVDWDPYAVPPRLVPELVSELPRVSDDGLELAFSFPDPPLRTRFADDPCFAGGKGRPVLPSDVVASWKRHEQAGGGPARAPHLLAGRIAKAIADDAAGTLQLRLTRPQPDLLDLLANPQLAIVPAECVAYYDPLVGRPPFREHPVGSGPFLLDHEASVPGRVVVLLAHTDGVPRPFPVPPGQAEHPDRGAVLPLSPRVVLEYIQEPETRLRLFQAGELAVLAPGPSQFSEVFDERGRLRPSAVPDGTRLDRSPVLAVDLLAFDTTLEPLTGETGLAIRRAVALAYDIERHVSVLRNGRWGRPLGQLVPSGILGHSGEQLHRYAPSARDATAAAHLLAKAGVAPDTVKLGYLCLDDEAALKEAAVLEQALSAIGIAVETIHAGPADYLKYVSSAAERRARGIHLMWIRWDADVPRPADFFKLYLCDASPNVTGHCDPELDRRVEALDATTDPAEQRMLVRWIEEQLGRDVPARPLDQPELWQLAQPWLRNVVLHPVTRLRIELLRDARAP